MSNLIGLTGNIGSGKSTAAAILADMGAVVVDADRLARDVVEPGRPAFDEIVARFGDGVLGQDGTIDRPALGRIVFHDTAARRELEAITHPRIQSALAEEIAAALAVAPPLIVVEVPLLFETGMDAAFPETLLVTAPDEVRLERILSRDETTAEDARSRMAAQMPQEEKLARATHIVVNDADVATLRRRLQRMWPTLVGG